MTEMDDLNLSAKMSFAKEALAFLKSDDWDAAAQADEAEQRALPRTTMVGTICEDPRGVNVHRLRDSLEPYRVRLPGGSPTIFEYLETQKKEFRPRYKPTQIAVNKLGCTVRTAPLSHSSSTLLSPITGPVGRLVRLFSGWEPWREERRLLEGIDVVLRPGEMTLVLGVPGAGASLLLSMISKRGLALKPTSGEILYNGASINKSHVARDLAYVGQRDVHTPLLTVAESLDFAVSAQMPASVPREHHRERRDMILDVLGLAHRADTLVGDQSLRGISGGEKRRLSVGLEMGRFPSAYLLDEPTSGLDVSAAFRLCLAFRGIAQSGPPVLMALKQPPFEVAALFNQVLVLGRDGAVSFLGTIGEGLHYFEQIGFECPQYVNPTDFFLDVQEHPEKYAVSGAHATAQPDYFSRCYRHSVYYGRVRNEIETIVADRAELTAERVAALTERLHRVPKVGPRVASVLQASKPLRPVLAKVATHLARREDHMYFDEPTYAASFSRQLLLGISRGWSVLTRTRQLFIIKMVRAAVAAFIISTLFWQLDRDQSGAQRITGFMFFVVTYFNFSALSTMADVFLDRSVLYRDRDARLLSTVPYLVSSMLVTMPMIVGEVLLFDVITYFSVMLNFRNDGWRFAFYLLVTFVMANVSEAIVRIIASLTKTFEMAAGLAPVLMVILFVYSGNMVTRSGIPDFLIWLYWINPVSYGYTALMQNMFDGISLYCTEDELVPPLSVPITWMPYPFGFQGNQMCPMTSGADQLARFDMDSDDAARFSYLLAMVTIYVILMALAIVGLSVCTFRPTPTPSRRAVNELTLLRRFFGYIYQHARSAWYGAVARAGLLFLFDYEDDYIAEQRAIVATGRGVDDDDGGASVTESSLALAATEKAKSDAHAARHGADVAELGLARFGFGSALRQIRAVQYLMDKKPLGGVLSWNKLFYSVNVGKLPVFKKKLVLLRNVEGYVRPGMALALMGASGAGKTTLLDVLARRKTTGKVTGDLLLNGAPLPNNYHRYMGYVEQVDEHDGSQTVLESVQFAAMTRMDAGRVPIYSFSQKLEFARMVLDALRLTDISHYRVGHGGGDGITAEQRKRLTLAVELAANPSILFLDEPTTGLDTVGAAAIVDAVQAIARSGRSVVCTVHQPSTQVFASFTHLLLLVPGGRSAYFGPIHDDPDEKDFGPLLRFFRDRGFICPPLVNPADFMLSVISDGYESLAGASQARLQDVLPTSEPAAAAKKLEDIPKEDRQALRRLVALRDAKSRKFKEASAEFWNNTYLRGDAEAVRKLAALDREELDQLGLDIKTVSGGRATWGVIQMALVVWRGVLMRFRSPGVIYGQWIGSLIIGLMLGFTFFQLDDSQQGLSSRVGLLFMVVLYSVFSSIAALQMLIEERPLFFRERRAGSYGYTSYLVRLLVVKVPTDIVSSAFLIVPVYFLAGLRLDVGAFFYLFMVSFLSTLLAVSFAQACAVIAPNAAVGTALVATVLQASMIFAGFFIRRGDVPVYWSWAPWLSFMAYPLEAALVNELRDRSFECSDSEYLHVPVGVNEKLLCPIVSGDQFLDILDLDNPVALYRNPLVTLLFAFFFFLLLSVLIRVVKQVKR